MNVRRKIYYGNLICQTINGKKKGTETVKNIVFTSKDVNFINKSTIVVNRCKKRLKGQYVRILKVGDIISEHGMTNYKGSI